MEVVKYAASLGEIAHCSIVTKNGAVALLFGYALYSEGSPGRPDKYDVYLALEAFVSKFVEFFGMEDVVVTLIKKHYREINT